MSLVCADCRRRGNGRPTKCHGKHCHAAGCRPARPLCRWMRTVQPARRVCRCEVFHFPHRAGSCVGHDNVPAAISSSPSWKRHAG